MISALHLEVLFTWKELKCCFWSLIFNQLGSKRATFSNIVEMEIIPRNAAKTQMFQEN